ncbi:hypothetical protein BDE40_1143 [Litoreibacter halocynthiae]|uniref:Uncharacterized protein n=1 Tax=Litoreibacter halocynthiae TaxID=1242689 RepID=A0A4R7LPX0_9RHOB|nr:hypothetical protein [Litoreibacter halocynthiae]TDT77844.1 hypothetical protein BDE40_1143 [Litoreibacter halocynthiae]
MDSRLSQPACQISPKGHPNYPPVILVLGLTHVDLIRLPSGTIPPTALVHFAPVDALDGEVLAELKPTTIISGLVSRGSDAFELARRLSDLKYEGQYQVLTTALPRPAMVRAEILSVAPDIDVQLLEIPVQPGA